MMIISQKSTNSFSRIRMEKKNPSQVLGANPNLGEPLDPASKMP